MPKELRVGVIGCGQIAKTLHVPDYATCGQAEIAALCDLDSKKAKALAERWAPKAVIYTDYKAMLKKERLDAVTVALPNYLHAPVTIAALKAGCHVMVEKPMAASPAEAQRMLDTAKKCKKRLQVNQCQRLFPLHIKAKEVLESGILGKILLVNGSFGHEGPENWSPAGKWFFKKKQARFGAMADLGVHKADLIRYLSGKEVVEVSAYMNRLEKKNSDVEDNFVSCLKFADGTMGTMTASWTIKGMQTNYTFFHCAKGSLRVGDIPDKPLVANLIEPVSEIIFDIPEGIHRYEGSWDLDVAGRFVRAILGDEEPSCTGIEGKKSLDIIFAAEKSALTGRSVKIKH